jgi:hypothetical protein
MTLNIKIVSVSLVVVFISVFALFYIFDNIIKVMDKCEKDKSLKICKSGSLPMVIMMLLLIAGGLIVIVNITAYIMISGTRSV